MATFTNLTNYHRNKLLDFLFRGQPYTPPATLYFAIFTTAATDETPGDEPADSVYHRAAITCSLSTFSGTDNSTSTDVSEGTGDTIYNIATILWPDPANDWGVITHWGIFDALTGGHYLYWGEFSTSREIIVGDSGVRFAPGTLPITLN